MCRRHRFSHLKPGIPLPGHVYISHNFWVLLHICKAPSHADMELPHGASPLKLLSPLLSTFWNHPSPRRLSGLGGGDPLAHRRVVVISNRLRDHVHGGARARWRLRRGGGSEYARPGARDCRAAARPGGIRAAPIRPLAEILAEEALKSARGGSSPFSKTDTRGYGESFCATLTDLAEANLSPEALRELSGKITGPDAARCARPGASGRVFPWHGMREREILRQLLAFPEKACERAEAEPPRVPTFLYGFAEMNALQRRLAAAVCREAHVPGSRARATGRARVRACETSLIDWFERSRFPQRRSRAA